MKFKFVVWMLILCAGFQGCDTENNTDPSVEDYFVKYYGGNGNQYGADMIALDDGTYLLLGNWETDETENRIYLVNIDTKGNVIWEKKLGTTSEQAKDLERTNDGNFIILSDYDVGGNTDVKVIKINSQGDKLDSAVYGSPGNEKAVSVTSLLDGGFIVAGSTEYDSAFVVNPVNPDDLSDVFHYRCNDQLVFDNFNWYEQYGPGTWDGGTRVTQNSNDLFYVFGFSNQTHEGNPAGNVNLMYYSIGAGGIIRNISFLGDFDNDTESRFVLDVPAALGGGFFIAGTETTPSGAVNLHVTKLRTPLLFTSVNDELFDISIPIESRKLTSFSAAASTVGQQGYLVLANEVLDDGTSNIWLSKIDQADGGLLWSTTFGSEEENDSGAAVHQLADGKILVLGTIGLINNQSKMVLMKLNSTGQLME